MTIRSCFAFLTLVLGLCTFSTAGLTSTTQHGATSSSLDDLIAVDDLISGLIPTELVGDRGWHPANPAATNGSLDPNGLPTFTNDLGGSGLNGLLNDFPPAGDPTKIVQYDLVTPTDIGSIGILSGNEGLDGRIFSTTIISFSTDGGADFTGLGYFQSDPSGTVNSGTFGSTYVSIFDDEQPILLSGVTDLIFVFYGVADSGGEMRDPFDGINPFTTSDDGLSAPIISPLIWEIDVNAPIPEPTSAALLALTSLTLIRCRRTA